jgi:inhibitor of the pro-sigma K processing machinery
MDIENMVDGAVTKLTAGDHIGSLIIVALLVVAAVFIFTKPIRKMIKLAINTVFGFISLIIVNYIGAFIGVTIGVNWVNAIIVAILGVPGVCLLFVLKWISMI